MLSIVSSDRKPAGDSVEEKPQTAEWIRTSATGYVFRLRILCGANILSCFYAFMLFLTLSPSVTRNVFDLSSWTMLLWCSAYSHIGSIHEYPSRYIGRTEEKHSDKHAFDFDSVVNDMMEIRYLYDNGDATTDDYV